MAGPTKPGVLTPGRVQRVTGRLKELANRSGRFLLASVFPVLRKLVKTEIIIAVILVLLWNSAYYFDTVLEWFPKFVVLQLKSHQWLFHSDSRKSRVKWTTIAEIDDETFYNSPVSGATPTNRRFLADLMLKIADAHPAVIALDIQLKSPGSYIGDDPLRLVDNKLHHFVCNA